MEGLVLPRLYQDRKPEAVLQVHPKGNCRDYCHRDRCQTPTPPQGSSLVWNMRRSFWNMRRSLRLGEGLRMLLNLGSGARDDSCSPSCGIFLWSLQTQPLALGLPPHQPVGHTRAICLYLARPTAHNLPSGLCQFCFSGQIHSVPSLSRKFGAVLTVQQS